MKNWNDTTPEEKISRSYKGSAVCFFIVVIIAVYLCISFLNVNKIKERCTAETQGKIISVHTVSKYNHQAYLYAIYTIEGKEYQTTGEYSSDDGIGFFGSGRETIPVYYDPVDPSVSYACDSPRKPSFVVWCLISAIFIVGGCLFIWQGKSIKRDPNISEADVMAKLNKTGFIHVKVDETNKEP